MAPEETKTKRPYNWLLPAAEPHASLAKAIQQLRELGDRPPEGADEYG